MGCQSSSDINSQPKQPIGSIKDENAPNVSRNDQFSFDLENARSLSKLQKNQEAEHAYLKMNEIYPNNWEVLAGIGTTKRLLNKIDEGIEWDLKSLIVFQNQIAASSLSIGYRVKKDYQKSEKYARMAIEKNARYSKGYNSLATLLVTLKRKDQAAEMFSKSIQIDPDFLLAITRYSNLLCQQGQYQKGIKLLLNYSQKHPSDDKILFQISLIYKNKLKDNEQAKQFLNKSLQINPCNQLCFNTLGNILNTQKKYQQSQKYFKKSIQLKPTYSFPYNGLGNSYYGRNMYNEAIQIYMKCIQLDKEYSTPYCGLGDSFKQLKQYDKAIQFYSKSIELNSSDCNPPNGLGNVYRQKGNLLQSKKWYLKSIQLNPNYQCPYNGIGNTMKDLREYEQAIKYYLLSIEKCPTYNFPYNGLGNVYQDLQKYEEAEKYYKRCMEIDPKYDRPYSNLANQLQKLNRYDEAVRLLLKAAELNPKMDSGYNTLGLGYAKKKDYPKAIDCYKKAIQNNPFYVLAYINISLAYIDIQNYLEAFKCLKEANKIIETSDRDVFGGCKSFIMNQLKHFQTEMNEWQFKIKNGYLGSQDKNRILSLRAQFQKRFKDIFTSNESGQTSIKLQDLNIKFLHILEKIRLDQFKLKNVEEIAKINYELFKENMDNFTILSFLFCKYFWLQKNINSLTVKQIEEKLEEKISNLCNIYPPSSSTQQQQNKIHLKEHFDEKNINLFEKVEYFNDYLYLVKAIEDIHAKCDPVLHKFKYFIYKICSEQGGYNSKANLKLPQAQGERFKVYIRIMEKMFKEVGQKKEAIIESIENKLKSSPDSSMQTVVTYLVQTWIDQITKILKERKQKNIPTKCFISDFVRGKSMFKSVAHIEKAANRIIDEAKAKGFEITEIDNRLGKETKDLVFKINIDCIVCEFQMAVEADSTQYNFSHCLYEIKRSPMGCIFGSYLFLSKYSSLTFIKQAHQIAKYFASHSPSASDKKYKESAQYLIEAFRMKS